MARTVVAGTKLLSLGDRPLFFSALSVSIPPGQKVSLSGRPNGILYPLSGSTQLPRHGWRTAGQGSGRDGAGGIHHAKQWRLDHVRQTLKLTACDTGDHRLAAITLGARPEKGWGGGGKGGQTSLERD